MSENLYTVTVVDGAKREVIVGSNYSLDGAVHTVDIAFRLMENDPGPMRITIERHREEESDEAD